MPAALMARSWNSTALRFNYTESVTEEEATALGEYLEESEFTDGSEKTVQLNKEDDVYQFRMVHNKDVEIDEVKETQLLLFAMLLSEEVFDGEEVELHLCDEYLETEQVLSYED